jgi:hypothetical protein
MSSRKQVQDLESELARVRAEVGQPRGSSQEPAAKGRGARTFASYEAEVEDLREQLEAIRQSASFRVGHALVRMFRPMMAERVRRRNRRRASDDGAKRAPSEQQRFPIPEGRRLLGPLNDKHCRTMFVVWGYSPDELDSLTDEIARLQLMLRDFKPLFVTDSDHWSAFQRHGYWFEYIPPAEDWTDHLERTEWPAYVSRRMDSIIATYRPDRIVVYDDGKDRDALKSGVLNQIVAARGGGVERPKLLPRTR